MAISFRCEGCRREVQAPDEAAGKRGKCPYCGQSNYIPAPVADEDLIPLAPLDQDDERRRSALEQQLLSDEAALRAESDGQVPVPLEQRENLTAADLHHFVVNFCLDTARGKPAQAQAGAEQLTKFPAAIQAVDDFLTGRAKELALKDIPPIDLQRTLRQLRQRIAAARMA